MDLNSVNLWEVPYGNLKIIGITAMPMGKCVGDCLVLHGAGAANKERVLPLIECMVSLGYATHAFDAVGHGATGGDLQISSLRDRSEQAMAVIKARSLKVPVVLVGASMGGFTALDLATRYRLGAKAIILLAPAVYANEAYRVNFGPAFSNEIRKPQSWQNADAWKSLKDVRLPLLVFIGTEDDVIPREIPDMLVEASGNERSLIERLAGFPHALTGTMLTDDGLTAKIGAGIKKFMATL